MAREHRGESGLRRLGPPVEQALVRLRATRQPSLRERWQRSRASLILAVQGAVAAGLAWFIANNLLHHNQPVFAPIAAVIVLDVSVGQRLRRTAELVFGVALGIGIGDALILAIGTGAWQVGLSVLLATVLSVFVAGLPAVVSQASTSAVLIATLSPPKTGVLYSSRFIDALIGGGVALAVLALLLPANPIASVARKAGPPCTVIVDALHETAEALRTHNAQLADAALTRLGEAGKALAAFRETLPESKETALLSPLRWRVRGGLERYADAAEYLERVTTNARVLIRRAVTMIYDDEPIPEPLPRSVQTLADATQELRRSLRYATTSNRVGELALQAVSEAAEAYRTRLGFSGSTVVAQIRAAATDLLGTTDLPHTQANELIRKAGGQPPKP
jgi:uncharacterized membrane protein YgaE (UPF0421/DUF939 family)